jgi:drug/metabolite transporter (DMT)-like permease
MQTLRAVDSTIINSTMTPQIVFLSVLFLGEQLNFLDWIGIILVVLSVLFIQVNQAQNFSEEK